VFESLTKRAVDRETLEALIRGAFGPEAGIARSLELNEGFFNAAFRITLTDGREVVLKASPTPDTPLLTYERDIMRGEAEFFRFAPASGVPLASVLHTGFDRTLIDGDYLVMSAVDGATWHSLEPRLDDGAKAALRRELGGIAARLHTVSNPAGRFGYPAVPELSGSTWPEAFLAMLAAVLEDSVRYQAPMPLPAADLLGIAARHADALAEVRRPALVHFDLWPGNVMATGVTGDGTTQHGTAPRISGLIDGERMIWGDPLMEFVGMDVFGRADRDPQIAAGYLGAGGTIDGDTDAERRLTLYHLYMQCLLLTEMGPRGYSDPGYLEFFGDQCPRRILAAADYLS
jgi:aminoglycoside phosphotransferase (APT) family kinase protein